MNSPLVHTEDALAFVEEQGVVLVSAKGDAPRLTEAIVGEAIKGSWWAHSQSHRIFAVLNAVTDSGQVLICRLVGGKVTLVHRRLWPHLVRSAAHFTASQIAQLREEHTASGKHVKHEVAFPEWVPAGVQHEAQHLTEQEAVAPFAKWTQTSKDRQSPSKSRPRRE